MPGYTRLWETNELSSRIEMAYDMLQACHLCPRRCGINRLNNEVGYCGIGRDVVVASYGPHFGEEPVLVGYYGSGTIFLAGCNLSCVYCQNFDISHHRYGKILSPAQVTEVILELQGRGCHNINFVTPTHAVPQIMEAIAGAVAKGLSLPIVYNSGGYDSLATLKLLEEVVDIYMPDIKYLNSHRAQRYSRAPDYPEVVRKALVEMHRQVGDLQVDSNGIAVKGLLVRHLVLPNGLSDTEEILRFIMNDISPHTFINVMDQYRPCFHACDYPELRRRITDTEYTSALEILKQLKRDT